MPLVAASDAVLNDDVVFMFSPHDLGRPRTKLTEIFTQSTSVGGASYHAYSSCISPSCDGS